MNAEALPVMVTVTADFMLNCWVLEILPYYHIQHIPEPQTGNVQVLLWWTWMLFLIVYSVGADWF
jgi:hypothetical protein